MKKKGLFLFVLLILIFIFIFVPAKADTGWDTDYDSSWGLSSSYDDYDYDYDDDYDYYDDDDDYNYRNDSNYTSSSGSHHSSSSGYDTSRRFTLLKYIDPHVYIVIIFIVYILVIFAPPFALILFVKEARKNRKRRIGIIRRIPKKTYNYVDIPNELALQYGIDDVAKLKKDLYNDFVALQEAWMNFDYDKMHSLCTDDLYNTYKSQLDVLKLKNNQNIMKSFVLDDIRLYDIYKQGDAIVINVYLGVNFYDYVIDTRTNAVVRGNSRGMVFNRYKLTYVRNVDSDMKTLCPNCGHELGSDASSKCPYCGTTIVNTNKKFVLSEKSRI